MSSDEDRVKQGSGKQGEGPTGSEWLPIEAPTEAEVEDDILLILDRLAEAEQEARWQMEESVLDSLVAMAYKEWLQKKVQRGADDE